VDDGCFKTLNDVPTRALTVTVPGLLASRAIFCTAPGALKKEAVRRTLLEPISRMCPATALRRHPRCSLYLDPDSASDITRSEMPGLSWE
jgi:glucosamine-6-phosphate deaminase